MDYCARCQILTKGKCPVCGRKTRQPEATDPVLFLMADNLRADMAEPVLEANEIPYARMGNLGAGLTMYTSPAFETFRFYVPYESLARAREVMTETFGEDREFMEHMIPDPEADGEI